MIILNVLDNGNFQSYKNLITLLIDTTDSFELVLREDLGLAAIENKLINLLSSNLIFSKKENEWAAQITNSLHTINRYECNKKTLDILLSHSQFFSDFGNKYSVEDLSFFKNNVPYFVSIGHEFEQYFLLKSKYEAKFLQKNLNLLNIVYDPELEYSV